MPVIDKPLLEMVARLIVWLEEWTGKDAACWLVTAGVVWMVSLSIWVIKWHDVGSREFSIDLALIALGVLTFALVHLPQKRNQVAAANQRQSPVRCDAFSDGYYSIMRPVVYVVAVVCALLCMLTHDTEYIFLSLVNVLAGAYFLIWCADVYPSTGGKKLKDKIEAFRIGSAKLARISA